MEGAEDPARGHVSLHGARGVRSVVRVKEKTVIVGVGLLVFDKFCLRRVKVEERNERG